MYDAHMFVFLTLGKQFIVCSKFASFIFVDGGGRCLQSQIP